MLMKYCLLINRSPDGDGGGGDAGGAAGDSAGNASGAAASGSSSAHASSGAPAAGNGGAAASWRDSLPAELKADPSIAKFPTVEVLAQSYINAQKLIGRDKIPMPTNDVELRGVFKRLGMPETPEGYDFKAIKLPENIKEDKVAAENIRKMSHQLGLTNAQAQQFYKSYWDNAAQAQVDHQQAVVENQQKSLTSLRKEWGHGFDRNLETAKRALKNFGGDEMVKLMENTRLGDDPRVIKMFAKMGAKMMEDGSISNDGIASGLTPNDIAAEIAKTMAHPAYFDKTHPEHKAVMIKAKELFEMKHSA